MQFSVFPLTFPVLYTWLIATNQTILYNICLPMLHKSLAEQNILKIKAQIFDIEDKFEKFFTMKRFSTIFQKF